MFCAGAKYLAISTVGLGLGIASTTTLSSMVDLAPVEARGTALRITGNRVGQVLVPFLASLIAVAAGTAGILLVIAFTLAASGTAVRVAESRSQ